MSADKLQELANKLKTAERVEAAYVTLPGVVPLGFKPRPRSKVIPPPVTPDFAPRQLYHKAAPIGFDARWAATLPGGRGAGVTIIDCEWGWQKEHESLARNFKDLVGENNASHTDHGTAVVGVLAGDRNPGGITGIAPAAIIKAYAFGLSKYQPQDPAPVIQKAAQSLQEGDVLLLDIHRPGPNTPKTANYDGQVGYLPVEWWPEDFAAIKQATDNGIVVIEAAGNGYQNLDDELYNKGLGFPASWQNPFRLGTPQSGAIMVGAAAPQLLSRHEFSNYGARLDVHGWGSGVYTTGYGDVQCGPEPNRWYTGSFSGTSSASPCVAGCVAVVQGVLKARGRRVLSPAEARYLLRLTGSAQRDSPSSPRTQRIGSRPDLHALIPAACGWASRTGDFDGDGRDEILATSPTDIAVLKLVGGSLTLLAYAEDRASLGTNPAWQLQLADDHFGPARDFDGDGKTELIVTSPRAVGILKLAGSSLVPLTVQPDKTTFSGGDARTKLTWTLDTAENWFGSAATYTKGKRAGILVSSPTAMTILEYENGTLRPQAVVRSGTRLGPWLVDMSSDNLGHGV
jgi:hypothetical protein